MKKYDHELTSEEMKQQKKKPKFLTVHQLVESLGENVISKPVIYAMIKKGEIPTIRLSNRLLIPYSWFEHLCNQFDNIDKGE